MNDENNLQTKRPSHRAYIIKDQGSDKKNRWIEIGAAWLHKDGEGFRVKLDAFPAIGDTIECRSIDWDAIDAGQSTEDT